jgi:hypothetical protein
MATHDADDVALFWDVSVIGSTPVLFCQIGEKSVWLPRVHISGKLWCTDDRGKGSACRAERNQTLRSICPNRRRPILDQGHALPLGENIRHETWGLVGYNADQRMVLRRVPRGTTPDGRLSAVAMN